MNFARVVVRALLVLSPLPGVAQDQDPKEAQNVISLNLYMTIGELLRNVPAAESLFGERALALCLPFALDYQRVWEEHFVLDVAPMIVYYRVSGYDGFTYDQVVAFDWHPFDRFHGGCGTICRV